MWWSWTRCAMTGARSGRSSTRRGNRAWSSLRWCPLSAAQNPQQYSSGSLASGSDACSSSTDSRARSKAARRRRCTSRISPLQARSCCGLTGPPGPRRLPTTGRCAGCAWRRARRSAPRRPDPARALDGGRRASPTWSCGQHGAGQQQTGQMPLGAGTDDADPAGLDGQAVRTATDVVPPRLARPAAEPGTGRAAGGSAARTRAHRCRSTSGRAPRPRARCGPGSHPRAARAPRVWPRCSPERRDGWRCRGQDQQKERRWLRPSFTLQRLHA